jgi:hypothetical protein
MGRRKKMRRSNQQPLHRGWIILMQAVLGAPRSKFCEVGRCGLAAPTPSPQAPKRAALNFRGSKILMKSTTSVSCLLTKWLKLMQKNPPALSYGRILGNGLCQFR